MLVRRYLPGAVYVSIQLSVVHTQLPRLTPRYAQTLSDHTYDIIYLHYSRVACYPDPAILRSVQPVT